MTASAWWLTVTYNPRRLNAQQRDGHACVICGTSIYVSRSMVPVGFVRGGGQVFACDNGSCPRIARARTEAGGAP